MSENNAALTRRTAPAALGDGLAVSSPTSESSGAAPPVTAPAPEVDGKQPCRCA